MKKILLYTLALGLMSPLFTSCLDEVQPTAGATQEQVNAASKDGLVNAITKYMNTIVNTNQYCDVGYPSMMLYRDIMTADMPVRDPGYYYFGHYALLTSLGDYQLETDQWKFFNALVHKCNLVITACDPNLDDDAYNLATAYVYRVLAEMDMTRMYEFRATGTALDATYLPTIGGLTVPIVNENTTEEKSFHNPRAPFYKMYRYMLTDLRRAEQALARNAGSGDKNKATIEVVNGMRARLWLEIASRFERFPEDLATAISHDGDTYESADDLGPGYELDPLGVTSADEAWQRAANYARAAINSTHTPLTESEWFNTSTGFNSATASSWMLAILMGSSDDFATTYTWQSWVSFMSPEAGYGISNGTYKASHMIDAALYSKIAEGDWRRYTWIDPDDFAAGESVFDAKYADKTNLAYADWSALAPYVGLKYHPGQGNGSTSQTGNCVDIPLMRVEEMYFIEAEALAHCQGAGAGKAAIESFMNTYRMAEGNVYTCKGSTVDAVVNEIILQKRIELWGEGLTIFDVRRLGLKVSRGYAGTNHPESYRYTSFGNGTVPAWSTLFIPRRENQLNSACLLNPDASIVTQEYKWKQ